MASNGDTYEPDEWSVNLLAGRAGPASRDAVITAARAALRHFEWTALYDVSTAAPVEAAFLPHPLPPYTAY